jgi:hypothetical protein
MRTEKAQIALREFLKEVGYGLSHENVPGRRKNMVKIPNQNVTRDLEELIEFCFPSALFQDPFNYAKTIADAAILCPTNNAVQTINDIAMEKMIGEARAYYSVDEPLESRDEYHCFRSDFNVEAIHNEMPSGMPPHKLTLKVFFAFYLILMGCS